VTWDLSGVNTGTYTVTVAVDDGCGVCSETKTETVEVVECDCVQVCECPTLTVDGPSSAVKSGETMTFTANVVGGNQQNITYNWEVSQGTIVSGQGTPQIVVGTEGLEDTNIQATVKISGDEGCNCDTEASETGVVASEPQPELVDEFGPIPNNDVKARLDIFSTRLANDPTSTGYVVNYGSSAQVTRRERLIRDYLVNEKGVEASRLVFVNGGVESAIRTRLWLVPAGADASSVNE
jgi:PKD repeat protein